MTKRTDVVLAAPPGGPYGDGPYADGEVGGDGPAPTDPARRGRTLLGWLAAGAALLSLAATAFWLVGLVFSDRAEWSQYIAYVPSIAPAAAALGLAAVTALIAALDGLLRAHAGRPSRRHTLARLALLGGLLAASTVLLRDLRVLNALGPGPAAGPTLRLVHWNTGSMWRDGWPDVLRALPVMPAPPDVIVLSNPPQPSALAGFAEAVGPGAHVLRLDAGFALASRWAVLQSRWFALGLPMPTVEWYPTFLPKDSLVARVAKRIVPLRVPRYPDSGDVAFVRLDTRQALGRELVLWMIDLPSDPRVPRAVIADQTVARLRQLIASGELPLPDVVVGDFNIPRGSDALARITQAAGATRHAFDDAGYGLAASWPRERPVLHIDHVFLRAGWRARAYGLVDGGLSDHLYQSAEIAPVP